MNEINANERLRVASGYLREGGGEGGVGEKVGHEEGSNFLINS